MRFWGGTGINSRAIAAELNPEPRPEPSPERIARGAQPAYPDRPAPAGPMPQSVVGIPQRTYLGLAGDCPKPRKVESEQRGRVVAMPVLGGLHHRYTRSAA